MFPELIRSSKWMLHCSRLACVYFMALEVVGGKHPSSTLCPVQQAAARSKVDLVIWVISEAQAIPSLLHCSALHSMAQELKLDTTISSKEGRNDVRSQCIKMTKPVYEALKHSRQRMILLLDNAKDAKVVKYCDQYREK